MRTISFDSLTSKEVISCEDCSRLGYTVDINIQLENAQITSIVVEVCSSCFSIKRNTITIPWQCIRKIGDDLIIVDYSLPPASKCNEKEGFLTRVFGK